MATNYKLQEESTFLTRFLFFSCYFFLKQIIDTKEFPMYVISLYAFSFENKQ